MSHQSSQVRKLQSAAVFVACLGLSLNGSIVSGQADVSGQAETAGGSAGSEEGRIALGALSYRVHCQNCHGATGTGNGPVAELLEILPADLTRLSERHDGKFPTDRVYRTIDGREQIRGHGLRQMPVWGIGFQDPGRDGDQEGAVRDKIEDLIAYLKSIQADPGP